MIALIIILFAIGLLRHCEAFISLHSSLVQRSEFSHRSTSSLSALKIPNSNNAIVTTLSVASGSSSKRANCSLRKQQNAKLPVWPIWSGVIAQVLEWIGLADTSEALLGTIGGRVVPVAFDPSTGFPFLLLVHHRHSFTPFDIFRPLTKILLPEGFPAHPHAGFDTVTYCIDGGLRHRDSEGFKMSYGDGEVQWMRAGRGIIHEEMWDLSTKEPKHQRIELFQLWVNLPEAKKYDPAAIHLLKREDINSVSLSNGDVQVKVIAGECFDDARVALPSDGSEVAG